MTATGTWKARERRAARTLGSQRQVGSGSLGRADRSRSDSTHPRLFFETKTRKSHAARTLFEATKILAKKEGKLPVLWLATLRKRGFLVCVHSDDLVEFARIVLEQHAQNVNAAEGGGGLAVANV